MIASEYSRPFLQSGQCIVADYDLQWIEDVLQEAAHEAGVSLPFRRELAEGVLLYLEEKCQLKALPLEYLFGRLRSVLRALGLPLIAEHLHEQMPPVDIELDALAGESPLPLFFYAKLRERMEALRRMGLTAYRFSGAHRCSLLLGSRRRACPAQRKMLQELESFLAAQAA
ncbi:MAG: hypothetical protein J1E42_04175 [Akkermansiaceae bacterium]|nr:hypothetical protein [Akkermansiaceae bacterium]